MSVPEFQSLRTTHPAIGAALEVFLHGIGFGDECWLGHEFVSCI